MSLTCRPRFGSHALHGTNDQTIGGGPATAVHAVTVINPAAVADHFSPPGRSPALPTPYVHAAEANPQLFRDCYRFGAALGQGGTASVREVTRLADNRAFAARVAEVSHAESAAVSGAPNALARLDTLARDVRALGRIDHPNVVRLIEFFVEPDRLNRPGCCTLISICEKIEGMDLQAWLRPDGRTHVTEELVWRVLRQGRAALQAIAAAGVVHGDIKPSNLMWSAAVADVGAELKVIDFGAAKVNDGRSLQLTHSRPAYSHFFTAPEVGPGLPPTAEADLYGFGATLLAIVAGDVPQFQQPNDLLAALRTKAGLPWSARLYDAIGGLLALDPAQRGWPRDETALMPAQSAALASAEQAAARAVAQLEAVYQAAGQQIDGMLFAGAGAGTLLGFGLFMGMALNSPWLGVGCAVAGIGCGVIAIRAAYHSLDAARNAAVPPANTLPQLSSSAVLSFTEFGKLHDYILGSPDRPLLLANAKVAEGLVALVVTADDRKKLCRLYVGDVQQSFDGLAAEIFGSVVLTAANLPKYLIELQALSQELGCGIRVFDVLSRALGRFNVPDDASEVVRLAECCEQFTVFHGCESIFFRQVLQSPRVRISDLLQVAQRLTVRETLRGTVANFVPYVTAQMGDIVRMEPDLRRKLLTCDPTAAADLREVILPYMHRPLYRLELLAPIEEELGGSQADRWRNQCAAHLTPTFREQCRNEPEAALLQHIDQALAARK